MKYLSQIVILAYIFIFCTILGCCSRLPETAFNVSESDVTELKRLLSDTSHKDLAEVQFLSADHAANLAEINHVKTSTNQKVIWTFWDKGYSDLSDFYKLNILTWRVVLGPEWKIRVLNNLPGDNLNAANWLDLHKDLPDSYNTPDFFRDSAHYANPSVYLSDMVRLGLLRKYGGIWMDSSNILLSSPEIGCWNKLAHKNKMLCGYYNADWSTKKFDYKSGFENWFIASSAGNELINRWFDKFKAYWDNNSSPKNVRTSPVFQGVDLSPFHIEKSTGFDWTTYLTQHVAFLAAVSDMRGQDLLKTQIVFKSDKNEARAFFSWDGTNRPQEAAKELFVDSYDGYFISWMFLNQSIIKFTGIASKPLRDLTLDQLLSTRPNNLTHIYRAVILGGQRGVSW